MAEANIELEKKVYRKLMDVRQNIQDFGEETFLKVTALHDQIKRGTFKDNLPGKIENMKGNLENKVKDILPL